MYACCHTSNQEAHEKSFLFILFYLYLFFIFLCVLNLKESLDKPHSFQEVEAPSFHDKQHMKLVWLSALCTSHL